MSGGAHPLAALIDQWEARSRQALPGDAMLINRHIRELRQTLAALVIPAAQPADADLDAVATAFYGEQIDPAGEETLDAQWLADVWRPLARRLLASVCPQAADQGGRG